jgi:hypothetical protein
MTWRDMRAVTVAAALLLAAPAAQADEAVDLSLVLAVDVSGSVDMEEARLQREGYVAAFNDDEIIEAITNGFLGKIAVTYFEWAGYGYNRHTIDWTIIDGPESAKAFAAKLANQPYHSARGTSISDAILWSIPAFDRAGVETKRRVVDVSGDGANNSGPSVITARNKAVAAGITINGLPILSPYGSFGYYSQGANLDLYYERCVIGGRNAFVIAANGFTDFANAIRQKLVLEISGREPDPSKIREARARRQQPSGFIRVAERPPYVMPCDMPAFN